MMAGPSSSEIQWCFSQVKGTLDDDVTDADIISCVEFNQDGDLLATGDKGGRVVIFQRDPTSKDSNPRRGEYNVYSTFQSHEPEFDYLKSLEIEEKINKIRWLKRKNPAHFLLSTNDKTIKLWKVSERDRRAEGYNLKEDNGLLRDPASINTLRVPVLKPMELMVEASPRRIFANAHTYHINSISVNSDGETYLSADDLRINLWHMEITDQSFNIVDIKPANMEELTEVITASEFHPKECNLFVYSSSKGTIRLCDMRQAALCDSHAKMFEEPEDPTNRSFFSEIISSISDVKFSNSGRYMISRDYLSVKVWDLHMETKPIETYTVHEYLRSKLCSLYENDCIFDRFECCWNGNDTAIMTGSYNNFFRMFDRNSGKEVTYEASREIAKPKTLLKPRKVSTSGKRKKGEIYVDCLDFNKKILHTAWHPQENIIAVAATNNLFLLQDKFWAGNGEEVVVDLGIEADINDGQTTANGGGGHVGMNGDQNSKISTGRAKTGVSSHEAKPSEGSPSKSHIVINICPPPPPSDISDSENHTHREHDAAEVLSTLSSPSPQPRSSSTSPQPASSSIASSSSAYESTSSIDSAPSSDPVHAAVSCSDLESSTTATSIEARNQEELSSDSAEEDIENDDETAK